jgi:hypothetical protein
LIGGNTGLQDGKNHGHIAFSVNPFSPESIKGMGSPSAVAPYASIASCSMCVYR